MAKLEAGLDSASLAEWKEHEQEWLASVVDTKKHKKLDNPYELKMDRGMFLVSNTVLPADVFARADYEGTISRT